MAPDVLAAALRHGRRQLCIGQADEKDHDAADHKAERRAEDAAADREHQVAQQTGSTDGAIRAQQHENRKDQKSEGFMESVKESLGKAGEAIKEAAVDAKDNVKQGAENMKERM